MRFVVHRTSTCFDESNPPCDNAAIATIERWDCRTFKTEAEHDARFPIGPWRSHGTNHGVWSGGIKRQMDDAKAWTIDIDSLDDLVQFVAVNGKIVLSEADCDTHGESALPEIEIYDDYRE